METEIRWGDLCVCGALDGGLGEGKSVGVGGDCICVWGWGWDGWLSGCVCISGWRDLLCLKFNEALG